MHEEELLARRFEADRDHLRAVAHRMLGSRSEADDAVQEAWLRLSRADTGEVVNLTGWLTTVVGRVCLDMLRSRTARREEPLEGAPTGVAAGAAGADPEHEALRADSVGLALLVVLDTLSPAERLAFVLHDLFGVSFDEIAPIVDRTPAAARQLASRARRRVRSAPDGAPAPDPDRQRRVVAAFAAAARGGDLAALLRLLDPNVTVRSALGTMRGADAVASNAITYATAARSSRLALIDGTPALVSLHDGRPVAVLAFTIIDDRITEIASYQDATSIAPLPIVYLPA
ncbi:sigma-70 family RNA polymerase sigma factor [Streptomyces mayteni]